MPIEKYSAPSILPRVLLILVIFLIITNFATLFYFNHDFNRIASEIEQQNELKSSILHQKQSQLDSLGHLHDSLALVNQYLQVQIEALKTDGYYLILDVGRHLLFLMKRDMLIYSDFFGSGKGSILVNGRRYNFSTPKKEFSITKIESRPWWIRPDWFWTEQKLSVPSQFITIPNHLNYYQAIRYYSNLSPEEQLRVRKVPGVLGRYKIYLQDGVLIHYGTGIGKNVSHGCIRVSSQTLSILFQYLKVGDPIYIF